MSTFKNVLVESKSGVFCTFDIDFVEQDREKAMSEIITLCNIPWVDDDLKYKRIKAIAEGTLIGIPSITVDLGTLSNFELYETILKKSAEIVEDTRRENM